MIDQPERDEARAQHAEIDALRAADERRALAYAEVEQRARNTMALVRSVFRRTVDSGQSLEELSMHFCGRLDVLARYQLPRSPGTIDDIDLEALIRDEFHDFHFGDAPGIVIMGPDAALSAHQAQFFALAIHELVTNALKFGALAGEAGRLSVTWELVDDRLDLVWAETEVAVLSVAPIGKGLGREFIEEGLPYQIGATTSFALRPGGVLVRIGLSLPKQISNKD